LKISKDEDIYLLTKNLKSMIQEVMLLVALAHLFVDIYFHVEKQG